MIDVANVRPLCEVLGPEWEHEDVMRLFEPEVRARLLVENVRPQRQALTTALNAVVHAMMPRHKAQGAYRLGEMRHFYQKRQVACVGKVNRAQLDALFAEPELPAASGPAYTYPLITFCGIAWREPVTDYNAGDYCRKCSYLAECREVVVRHNGLALCEIVLEGDLIPEGLLYDVSRTC